MSVGCLFVAISSAFYSAGPIALMIVSAVIQLFLLETDHVEFAFYSAGPIALMIASAMILLFLLQIDHVERSTYNLLSGFSRTEDYKKREQR